MSVCSLSLYRPSFVAFVNFFYGFYYRRPECIYSSNEVAYPILICTRFLKNWVWKSSWMNLIFCLFWTWILQATQAVKIKFEIDQKSSSSNLIFQTWFFRKQLISTLERLFPHNGLLLQNRGYWISLLSRPHWMDSVQMLHTNTFSSWG